MNSRRDSCPFLLCIGGLPGSGKTHYRTSEPLLTGLPFVDIADVYRENDGIDWEVAFDMYCRRVGAKIQSGEGRNGLVLEAYFKRKDLNPIEVERTQRHRIEEFARNNGCRILYIWMHAPEQVCRQRVQSDTRDGRNRLDIRLEMISAADSSEFERIPGEESQQVMRLVKEEVIRAGPG